MKVPRIFQYADRHNRSELLKYATYQVIQTNTPNNLYISDTFNLNDYRICYIIYDKCICVLVKKNNDNHIYTGYTIYLRKIKSETLGLLGGISHYVPTIVLTSKWDDTEKLLFYVYTYFQSVFKFDLPFSLFTNFLYNNNFLKDNYFNDDDNGINEYEKYIEKWIYEEITDYIEYFDI
jgi:hypothetical protein